MNTEITARIASVLATLNARGDTFWNGMLSSFSAQAEQGRTLSPKQMACLEKAEAQAARFKPKAVAVPVSDIVAGRYEVEFVVTSLKDYATGGYSWGYETIKAVGVSSKGFKVYVSIPEALQSEVKVGSKVVMTATVSPKEDGFASLTRPFNARLVG